MLIATHRGGPLDGQAASLAAPSTPERIFWAKAPAGIPFIVAGHIIVGHDTPPEREWPEQVEYVLDRETSDLKPHPFHEGMEVGTAVYEVAS